MEQQLQLEEFLIALIENNQTEEGKVEFTDKVAEIIGVKNLG